MKNVFKISVIVSMLLFGGSVLQASSKSDHSTKYQNSFSPVLEAADLIQVASKLDRSNTTKALSLLNKARAELKNAKVSPEIKKLDSKIALIQKAVKDNQNPDKLYHGAIFEFNSYVNKIKDWGYEIRAHDEEAADIEKFKIESKSDVF